MWTKMATISKSREIDYNKIISSHELTITSRAIVCFLSETYCVAVDEFGMLHLLQKTEQIKTGADLVNAACLWVDN